MFVEDKIFHGQKGQRWKKISNINSNSHVHVVRIPHIVFTKYLFKTNFLGQSVQSLEINVNVKDDTLCLLHFYMMPIIHINCKKLQDQGSVCVAENYQMSCCFQNLWCGYKY